MTMHPHTDDELAAQRGGEIVRAAALSVSAPPALREALERQRATSRRSPRRGLWLAGGLAGAMVVVALAVLLAAPSGTPAGPTVVQAATLGMQPATGPAPAQNPLAREHVKAREGRVSFPYWADDVKWRASGVRRDTIAGRHATTVFYDGLNGDRVAYTVVAIPALRTPAGQHQGQYTVLRHGGSTIVTWREHGQTCLISMRTRPGGAKTLVWLAEQDQDV
jgi:hypothetical protein